MKFHAEQLMIHAKIRKSSSAPTLELGIQVLKFVKMGGGGVEDFS